MYRRSHYSWREPKTPFRSIGEVYLGAEMFSSEDEGASTIGQAAIGENALQIIQNRRKVKGRLSDLGAEELKKVVEKVKSVFPDFEIKVAWDRYCGCSMCPCSPGYRIKIKTDREFVSNAKNRFSLHIDRENGNTSYSFFKPKDTYWIGYDKVGKLQNEFSDGK